jgi:hypothetical protein
MGYLISIAKYLKNSEGNQRFNINSYLEKDEKWEIFRDETLKDSLEIEIQKLGGEETVK